MWTLVFTIPRKAIKSNHLLTCSPQKRDYNAHFNSVNKSQMQIFMLQKFHSLSQVIHLCIGGCYNFGHRQCNVHLGKSPWRAASLMWQLPNYWCQDAINIPLSIVMWLGRDHEKCNMDWTMALCSQNTEAISGNRICLRPANVRWRYIVKSSFIGWAHARNDPWAMFFIAFFIHD